MKELYMEFNKFMWVRNNKDRIMFYEEKEDRFKLMMPIKNILLITEKMKIDLIESNIPLETFRNTQLSRGFEVREYPEIIIPIEDNETQEYVTNKFVGWQFGGSKKWIIEYLKDYDFPLITDITEKERKLIKNIIIEGIKNSWNVKIMQEKLMNLLDNENKVETIMRTEIVRGASEGALNRYEVNGVKKVRWLTTIDGRNCEDCLANHGKEFTIEEARGKIPLHPQCRCCFLPIVE